MFTRFRSTFPALAGIILFACTRSHSAAHRLADDTATRPAIVPPPPSPDLFDSAGLDSAPRVADTSLALDAGNAHPDSAPFAISIAHSRIWLDPGEEAHLLVELHRDDDFDAPIELRLLGLPEDIRAAAIQTSSERAWLPLRVSPDSSSRSVPCTIEARGGGWHRVIRVVLEIGTSSQD